MIWLIVVLIYFVMMILASIYYKLVYLVEDTDDLQLAIIFWPLFLMTEIAKCIYKGIDILTDKITGRDK
jgi:hypothetical protein